MGIIKNIQHKLSYLYRRKIVCEQFPMLTSISRKEWQEKKAIGIVFTLHHIKHKNPHGIPTNEDLIVSPKFLERTILKYKSQGFNFISLDELYDIITSDKKVIQPFITFTIDDGYKDNYSQALPVFEYHNVPFAIFMATDFIDHKAVLWWDILEGLISKNDSIVFKDQEYRCHSFNEKWDTFRIVRESILNFDQKNIEQALKESFSNYTIDWHEPVQRQAMSWEQVKAISQHPLCTIGGHTVSHLALNKLSDQDFRQEVADGVAKLQSATGKPIRHFAYPYGSPNEIGEREFKLISEFNFKTVFTAYGGCITEYNKRQLTHLPRVYLYER